MKNFSKIMLILSLSIGTAMAADKKDEDYIKDLQSQDDKTVMAALDHIRKEQVKDAITPLHELMKTSKNEEIRVSAAAAMGAMDTEGKPTTFLDYSIQNDSSNVVVYASLVAILQLGDKKNEAAKKSVEFCEKNKTDDVYIMDAVKRIKEKFYDQK